MPRRWLPVCMLGIALVAAPCFAQDVIANAGAIRSYYEAELRGNGQVVSRDDYGVQSKSPDVAVDDNTAYHWASCAKTFTGIAIMQLRDYPIDHFLVQ